METGRKAFPALGTALELLPCGRRPHWVRSCGSIASLREYLDMDVPTPESAERYLSAVVSAWEELHGTERIFAIESKEAGRIAGLIRIEFDGDEGRQGDVGYCLDSDFQGRGYATEVLEEVVRLRLEELGLRRIWATVDTRNEKSWKVLERAGFRREKRMAGHRSIRGVPEASYLDAIPTDKFA